MFANIWKSKYAATIFTVVSIFTMVVGIKIFLERDYIQSVLTQELESPRRILTADRINRVQAFKLARKPSQQEETATSADDTEIEDTPNSVVEREHENEDNSISEEVKKVSPKNNNPVIIRVVEKTDEKKEATSKKMENKEQAVESEEEIVTSAVENSSEKTMKENTGEEIVTSVVENSSEETVKQNTVAKVKTSRIKKQATVKVSPKKNAKKDKKKKKKKKEIPVIMTIEIDMNLKRTREAAISKIVLNNKQTGGNLQSNNVSSGSGNTYVGNLTGNANITHSSGDAMQSRDKGIQNNPSTHPVQRFFAESQPDRQAHMQNFCQNFTIASNLSYNRNFIYSDKKAFTYCRVPKVACKTWKKIVGYIEGFFDSPLNVSRKELYSGKYPYFKDITRAHKPLELKKRVNGFFSFTFSRHPFDRLFSAYRNKIQNPPEGLEMYLRNLGPKIVNMNKQDPATHPKKMLYGKEYLDVSFEDFARYVLTGVNKDKHWALQTTTCHICKYKFSFLGKFETMSRDANQLFDLLGIDIERLPEDGQYSTDANALMRSYYNKLPRQLIDQIYKFYIDDFMAYGYGRHDYF